MKQLKNASKRNDEVGIGKLEDAMEKYKDYDEDDLIAELMKSVKRAKEDGSFNEEALSGFVDLVSPHLSDVQKEKLINLIAVIKAEN